MANQEDNANQCANEKAIANQGGEERKMGKETTVEVNSENDDELAKKSMFYTS